MTKLRSEPKWIWGMLVGPPLLILGTIAYPHIDRYLHQTPLERCVSSKSLSIHAAEHECRIELGMEPNEEVEWFLSLTPKQREELVRKALKPKDADDE